MPSLPLGASLRGRSLTMGASLRAGLLLTFGALLPALGASLRTVVPALGATLSCLAVLLATLRAELSLGFAVLLLAGFVALLLGFTALLPVLAVLLAGFTALLLLVCEALLRAAASREIFEERLLVDAVDLEAADLFAPAFAAFTFEEEPLLLLPAVAVPVAAPLLVGELFCTLVEEDEAVLAVLLDCPITSFGLTHIITMMRESAISANFFMTVICLG